MAVQIFSIRDTIVGAFMLPFFAENPPTAFRRVLRDLEKPNSELLKNAKDCILYHLGEYDEFTGAITPLPQPVSFGVLSDWAINPPSAAPKQ